MTIFINLEQRCRQDTWIPEENKRGLKIEYRKQKKKIREKIQSEGTTAKKTTLDRDHTTPLLKTRHRRPEFTPQRKPTTIHEEHGESITDTERKNNDEDDWSLMQKIGGEKI